MCVPIFDYNLFYFICMIAKKNYKYSLYLQLFVVNFYNKTKILRN